MYWQKRAPICYCMLKFYTYRDVAFFAWNISVAFFCVLELDPLGSFLDSQKVKILNIAFHCTIFNHSWRVTILRRKGKWELFCAQLLEKTVVGGVGWVNVHHYLFSPNLTNMSFSQRSLEPLKLELRWGPEQSNITYPTPPSHFPLSAVSIVHKMVPVFV